MTAALRQVDPRTRMAVVMVVSTLAVAIRDPRWLLGVLAVTACTLLVLGGGGLTAARFRRLWPLLLTLLVIQSAFVRVGEPLLTLGPRTLVTSGGVMVGVSVMVRLLVIISSASLLMAVDPLRLVQGLIQLRVPYELAFMVLLGVRFLPLLAEDIGDALTAVQLRGVNLKEVPAGERLGVYRSIFLPVVVSSVLRAQKTATAMEARAFRAYPRRTYVESLRLTGLDLVIMATAAAGGTAYLALYLLGGR